MRAKYLLTASLVLSLVAVLLSLASVDTTQYSLASYGYGNVGYPPQDWRSVPWAVVLGYLPNASVTTAGGNLSVSSVTPISLNSYELYVYQVRGVVQPYYFLSVPSLILALTSSLLAFKSTFALFYERVTGETLNLSGVGTLKNFLKKRTTSYLVTLFISSSAGVALEVLALHRPLERALKDLITMDMGVSRVYGISSTLVVLEGLSFTSLLIAITFTVSVVLSVVVVVYSLSSTNLRRVVSSWRYIGSAIATWVLSEALIYLFHFQLGVLPIGRPERSLTGYLILPFVALFIPYVGILANRVYSTASIFKPPREVGELKNLGKDVILHKHVLGHVSVVMLNGISSAFVEMLIGEAMAEVIFGWPGIGTVLRVAVSHGDMTVAEGSMLSFSLILILSAYVTDLVYGILDPRVRR